jgi:hypothetical protein
MKEMNKIFIVAVLSFLSTSIYCQQDTLIGIRGADKVFPYKIDFDKDDFVFSQEEKQKFERGLQITLKVNQELREDGYRIGLRPSGCDKLFNKNISLYIKRCEEIIEYLEEKIEGIHSMIFITFDYECLCCFSDDCAEDGTEGVVIYGIPCY